MVRQMLVNKHGIVVNSRINQLCRQRTPIYISLWKISFVQEFIFAPFGSLPDLHTVINTCYRLVQPLFTSAGILSQASQNIRVFEK